MTHMTRTYSIARLKNVVARTGMTVVELAVLISAFDALAYSGQLLKEGKVPAEELTDIPDPEELLVKEADMTTAEGVTILSNFLDMSPEGEARLWRLLQAGQLIAE
jgi:hypothetical protein